MRTSLYPELSPGFFLMLAAMVLMLPLRWCLALLAAALFHESCHLLALRLCGGQPLRCRLGTSGASILSAPLTTWKILICTLAGPLGGFLLVPFARWFPRLALCAAAQSAFNLLPLSSLDGGHILRCSLELLLPRDIAGFLCRYTELLILVLTAALGLYCTFVLKLGLLPILAAGMVILKGRIGKTPCK